MDIKQYTEQNRLAWNEVTPRHIRSRRSDITERLARTDYIHLDEVVVKKLLELGIQGKNVAQICCNTGVETVSLKKLGAHSCVGFDISDEAINEAIRLSEAAGIDVSFVRTDIYDIPDSYCEAFDLVFISVGTLGWMPDLEAFFRKAISLLNDRGIVFIYEMHPIIDIFDENEAIISYSYFKDTPFVDNESLDYIGKSKYEFKIKYWFPHTMSGIIHSIIDQGVRLQYFQELPNDISTVAGHLESDDIKLPLSYLLVGEKTLT